MRDVDITSLFFLVNYWMPDFLTKVIDAITQAYVFIVVGWQMVNIIVYVQRVK